jgi:uncharacterized protein
MDATMNEDQYAEIPYEEEYSDRLTVKIENIDGYTSVDRVIRAAREGHVVLAKIKQLREENVEELKHCISKLKNAVNNFQGDIIGIGEEFVLVTPKTARIERV